MPLGHEELSEIIDEVYDKIRKEIMFANRLDNLEAVFAKYGYGYESNTYNKLGKILVIGDAQISKNHAIELAKDFDIDVDRLELVLGYDKAKKFNFHKLRHNTNYSNILIGPIAHKTKGVGKSNSIINKLENPSEGYLTTIRLLNSSRELCINKETLKKALSTL